MTRTTVAAKLRQNRLNVIVEIHKRLRICRDDSRLLPTDFPRAQQKTQQQNEQTRHVHDRFRGRKAVGGKRSKQAQVARELEITSQPSKSPDKVSRGNRTSQSDSEGKSVPTD